jgi:hypothetical protein
MHKRTLILHIGMHKTGSSALQLALLKHKTDDYEFVTWDKFGNPSNIVKCEMGRYSIIVPRLEKLLNHTSSDRVILSAEHLFFWRMLHHLKYCILYCRDILKIYKFTFVNDVRIKLQFLLSNKLLKEKLKTKCFRVGLWGMQIKHYLK